MTLPARTNGSASPEPPGIAEAVRGDTVDALFGHRVPDPYRVLEDAGAPATRAWSAAQEALFRAHVEALPGRDRLRERLGGLLATGMVGVPDWRGGRCFAVRREPDREHPVLTVTEPDGTTRVLVDPMAVDPSGATTLDGWEPSVEGDRLAYLLSSGGTEESELYVLDVAGGSRIEGPIDRVRNTSIAWLPGGGSFYVVRRLAPGLVPEDEEQHHRRVYLHRVGTDPADDVEVFGAGSPPATYFGVGVDPGGRRLLLSAAEGTAPRNDLWVADLEEDGPERLRPVGIQEGLDAQTGAHIGRDGRLYLFTDHGAPRGRICVADPASPGPAHWRELIAEDPEAVMSGFVVLDGPETPSPVLLVTWTRHAVGELTVHDAADGRLLARPPVPSGAPGSIGAPVGRPEGGHEAWFGWSAFDTPSAVLRYDARSGLVTTWATAPGTVAVPDVRVHHEVYTSADGRPVRMFVIAPTDAPDRPRPAILYGYGGFGIALGPAYSPSALAWVEAGGVYAVACLRGGSEEGEEWHRAGMREHKQRVFDDFDAAAEHLTARGWSAPDRLAASGGSNGGLLVGAALTRRPELYAAVACSMPLLDMVRYERFGLGRLWSDEYGSASVPGELEWLLSYSPYHHVREGVDYPAVLFTVFDGDTRVDPLHARKMCAALCHATAGDRPVLLRAEAEVGHASRSVSRTIGLSVDTLSFLAHWTGLALDSDRDPNRDRDRAGDEGQGQDQGQALPKPRDEAR